MEESFLPRVDSAWFASIRSLPRPNWTREMNTHQLKCQPTMSADTLQTPHDAGAVSAASVPIGLKVAHVRAATQARNHHCHWPGCGKQVSPARWGCLPHWKALPIHLQRQVWSTYRPHQEKDGRPSRDYIAVARAVQQWIVEHHPVSSLQAAAGPVSPEAPAQGALFD